LKIRIYLAHLNFKRRRVYLYAPVWC